LNWEAPLILVRPLRAGSSLVSVGWSKEGRVHGCLIHVSIQDGKVWVQRDGTQEGIANELVRSGIPKEDIVLGFHEPEIRPHTGFAVA
jgi:XisI protein